MRGRFDQAEVLVRRRRQKRGIPEPDDDDDDESTNERGDLEAAAPNLLCDGNGPAPHASRNGGATPSLLSGGIARIPELRIQNWGSQLVLAHAEPGARGAMRYSDPPSAQRHHAHQPRGRSPVGRSRAEGDAGNGFLCVRPPHTEPTRAEGLMTRGPLRGNDKTRSVRGGFHF